MIRAPLPMMPADSIVRPTDPILITGSNGFIGCKVVEALLAHGLAHLRCLVRPSSDSTRLKKVISAFEMATIEVVEGNLLSRDDCRRVVDGTSLIYHLAAARGEKSYPHAYMNSVITTRNLLDAVRGNRHLKRFVCVSSFTVYSTVNLASGALLDEECDTEQQSHLRGEAYCYAKVRQEELVQEYGNNYGIPYVIARPGVVYGPGNNGIPGRVGISTFGIFLHLGGSNTIPLSYVDNCAEALALAGLKAGVDREIFNIVDDDLPTSRTFLKLYKERVRHFRSIDVPRPLSYFLCYLWEKYSEWSEGQLPPVFNRNKWAAYWKGNTYSNAKAKRLLGWRQTVAFAEASMRYFESERQVRSEP